jgi:hypothetical protein
VTTRENAIAARAEELERWMLTEFGPVLSGRTLRGLLGYPSPDAFRQAHRRHGAPVRLFLQEGRKGWCASTRDVASWIARTEALTSTSPPPPKGGQLTPKE